MSNYIFLLFWCMNVALELNCVQNVFPSLPLCRRCVLIVTCLNGTPDEGHCTKHRLERQFSQIAGDHFSFLHNYQYAGVLISLYHEVDLFIYWKVSLRVTSRCFFSKNPLHISGISFLFTQRTRINISICLRHWSCFSSRSVWTLYWLLREMSGSLAAKCSIMVTC